MKKILASVLVVITIALPVYTGCKTSEGSRPPVTVAYMTLATVQNGVNKSLEVYGIKRAKGKVSDEQRAKIKEAYTHYQALFATSIELARFNYSTPAPEELARLALTLETLIYNL